MRRLTRLPLFLLAIGLLQGVALGQIPEKFTNLKVLPADTSRAELMGLMRSYSGALGVRCIHCHDGEDPSDLSSVDFASDARETKQVARAMMRMVNEINASLLPSAGREAFQAVACQTCHHGVAIPRALGDLLAEVVGAEGIDAGLARYRELREEYHGSGAYDFSPATLNSLAETLAREQQDATQALRLVELNLEYYPDSHYTLFMKGGLLAAKQDYDGAIASISEALELDPDNGWYEKTRSRLEAARKAASEAAGSAP